MGLPGYGYMVDHVAPLSLAGASSGVSVALTGGQISPQVALPSTSGARLCYRLSTSGTETAATFCTPATADGQLVDLQGVDLQTRNNQVSYLYWHTVASTGSSDATCGANDYLYITVTRE